MNAPCIRNCGQYYGPNSKYREPPKVWARVAQHRDGISKRVSLRHLVVWIFQGNGWAVCEQPTKITASIAGTSTKNLGTFSAAILLSHKNSKYVEKILQK